MCQLALPWGTRHLFSPELAGKDEMTHSCACHAVYVVLRERTIHLCISACNMSQTQDPLHTFISCKALQLTMQGLPSRR